MTTEILRYNYRLRPGRKAEAALLAEWGRCRWLWNEAVHQQRSGVQITKGHLGKLLTEARQANAWLRGGWQNAQATTLDHYVEAIFHSRKIKGQRLPGHRRARTTLPSIPFTRNGFSVKDGRLRLPKGTVIPVVWSRDLPSEPTTCQVFRDSLGHWYVSFVVRRESRPAPPADGRIGIDWGISATATTTDPEFDLPHLGHRRRCAAELARIQRKMSRRKRPKSQPPSRRYLAVRLQSARLQKRASRQNKQDARAWAKKVVDSHSFIAVEDFKLKIITRSSMARKSADAAVGATKRELIERGRRAGREVVLVSPAYTSMTCSACGTRAKERIALKERTFVCLFCGLVEDRDRNAARVILDAAERGRVGADDVRHLVPSPRVGDEVRSEPESHCLAQGRR